MIYFHLRSSETCCSLKELQTLQRDKSVRKVKTSSWKVWHGSDDQQINLNTICSSFIYMNTSAGAPTWSGLPACVSGSLKVWDALLSALILLRSCAPLSSEARMEGGGGCSCPPPSSSLRNAQPIRKAQLAQLISASTDTAALVNKLECKQNNVFYCTCHHFNPCFLTDDLHLAAFTVLMSNNLKLHQRLCWCFQVICSTESSFSYFFQGRKTTNFLSFNRL